jgi:hypothetical protein
MRINPVVAGIAAAAALYIYRRHQRSKLPVEEQTGEVSPVLPVIVGVAVWGAVQVFNDCKCPGGDDIQSDFESGLMDIDQIERLDMQQPAAFSKMQDVYDDIWQ